MSMTRKDRETKVISLWCAHCDRMVDEQAVTPDRNGALRCPTCTEELSMAPPPSDTELPGEVAPKAPWHFKVLVVGTGVYLLYRLAWFIALLFHHAWNG